MYNDIASVYHLVYPDWEDAIRTQSKALNEVIVEMVGSPPLSVLDVSCGIGTQALGLAVLGHRVVASDLSEKAVERARNEARQRNLDIEVSVADMRECAKVHGEGHDVVLSADNSIPHLETEHDVRTALLGFYACLKPGGICLVSIRNYLPDEDRSSPQMWSYGFRSDGNNRYVVFQTRDWNENAYDVGMYFVREATEKSPASVVAGLSRYYAISVDRVMSLFEEAGFVDVQRFDGVLHQPVIVGKRRGA